MKLLINILSTLIGLLWFGVGCWQHDKVDDAMGNAEALLHMINEMGLKFKF